MTVLSPKSKLLQPMERVLDDNENFIGPKIWDQLESVYNELDKSAKDLEDDYAALEEQLAELNSRITALEDENETLTTEIQVARDIISSNS
jgi:peptidoglycan hydrolase CwlO-like protein